MPLSKTTKNIPSLGKGFFTFILVFLKNQFAWRKHMGKANQIKKLTESLLKKQKRVREAYSDDEYNTDNAIVVLEDHYGHNQPVVFVEDHYDELVEQGFQKEADLIQQAYKEEETGHLTSLQDKATTAWSDILDKFLYDGEYCLGYGDRDGTLYAFPIKG